MKRKRYVHRISFCCLIAILGFTGLHLYQYRQAQKEYEELSVYTVDSGNEQNESGVENNTPDSSSVEHAYQEKLKALMAQNPDTVAWLQIPDTTVDYPVLYSGDNEKYMNHTFSGEENPAGAIFIEQLNAVDFTDKTIFLYGHNMRDGSMFGSLKQYRDKAYYQEHPIIKLYTREKELEYEIFSVHRADTTTGTYTLFQEGDSGYDAYLESEKQASIYDTRVEVTAMDQILILVTCTSDTEEGRFVVLGRLLNGGADADRKENR